MANGVTNLGGFDDFIDDAVGEIQADAEDVVLKLGMDLWRSIVLKTPVDTGRARQSWNLQWGKPDGQVPSEGGHGDMPSMPNPGAKTSDELHISSNLHYIKYLEAGRPGPGSRQAPRGMVKISIEELKAQI